MLKENLILLRNAHGFSQEEIAEKVNISRQAYAKWESGTTVPDIIKCSILADVYGVTVDSLLKSETADVVGIPAFVPKGKNIWGTVTVNERGQIVIPKTARDKFGLTGGTRLVVLSNETGIALVTAEKFEEHLRTIMEMAFTNNAE